MFVYRLYNELTDAFAYCIQLSDSVDSSSTPQLQLLQSSLGLPPPSIALDKQFKLFLSFAAELVAQVDSLRILKLCAGLLADIRKLLLLLLLLLLQCYSVAAAAAAAAAVLLLLQCCCCFLLLLLLRIVILFVYLYLYLFIFIFLFFNYSVCLCLYQFIRL